MSQTHLLRHVNSEQCMEKPNAAAANQQLPMMSTCDENNPAQRWLLKTVPVGK